MKLIPKALFGFSTKNVEKIKKLDKVKKELVTRLENKDNLSVEERKQLMADVRAIGIDDGTSDSEYDYKSDKEFREDSDNKRKLIIAKSNGFDPGETFLLNSQEQEEEFNKNGFFKVYNPLNYGLVNRTAQWHKQNNNKEVPMYLKFIDAIPRDSLEVIGNRYSGTQNISNLNHAQWYPQAFYVDKDYNFYVNGWDMNDYGDAAGTSGIKYINLFNDAANYLDKVGNPFVQVSGILKITPSFLIGLNTDNWTPRARKYDMYGLSTNAIAKGLYELLEITNDLKLSDSAKNSLLDLLNSYDDPNVDSGKSYDVLDLLVRNHFGVIPYEFIVTPLRNSYRPLRKAPLYQQLLKESGHKEESDW